MQIVITDGFTLNPGDLSWDPLKELGELIYYHRSPADKVYERCAGADVIVTNKTPITAEVINAANSLKLIAVTATGYNNIDLQAANARNIPVCNVPAYGTFSVAQHTIALILALSNHVAKNSESVFRGEWSSSPDWCYTKSPITELEGKILGVVGFGKIGQQVARIATAFGMNVIYYDRSEKSREYKLVSVGALFAESDVVSLHCPLKPENQGFVNIDLLSSMKPSAFLVNTARGLLINEGDLAFALKKKLLAGAALDVLSAEPPAADHPLIKLHNCVITPHNAWLSVEARKRIMEITVENIRMALSGNPQHVVNRK